MLKIMNNKFKRCPQPMAILIIIIRTTTKKLTTLSKHGSWDDLILLVSTQAN